VERHVVVVPGGVLDRLQWLSERVASMYSISAAEATQVVLTHDWIPDTKPSRAEYTRPSCRSFWRVLLDLDPDLTPKEVMKIYSEARSELLSARPRSIGLKNLWLAFFVEFGKIDRVGGISGLTKLGELSVEEARLFIEKWNSLGTRPKEWRYDPENVYTFVRDYNETMKRLMEPPYKHPRRKPLQIERFRYGEEP